MARITYDFLANMSGEFIGGLSRSEARDLLRKAREKFKIRQKQLEKVERSVYSYSLEQTKEYYSDHPQKAISRTSRQEAQRELTRLRDFFASEGSTVQGARRIQREQDIRIFGAKEDGSPAKRMTLPQRKKYWEVYNEFMHQYKTFDNIYQSNSIQVYLGQIQQTRKGGMVNMDDFSLLLDILSNKVDEKSGGDYLDYLDYSSWESPTYSGTRNY